MSIFVDHLLLINHEIVLSIQETMDESQAASQQIIQYLPIMFGFFALNVPSGLAIYWVTNTLFSTAATVFIKQQVQTEMEATGLSVASTGTLSSASSSSASSPSSFANMMESTTTVSPDSTFTPIDADVIMEPENDMMLRPVEGFASSTPKNVPASSKSKSSKKKKKGKKSKN